MRYTAIFEGTAGPGGTVDPETSRLYYLFDAQENVADPDKPVANAVMHIRDGLSGEPKLVEVLVGGFLPHSMYRDPWKQRERERKAERVTLYEYTLNA